MSETSSNLVASNPQGAGTVEFTRETSSSIASRSEQESATFRKQNTPVDLRRPFDEVVSSVLSLPWGHEELEALVTDAELRTFLRGVHEAANGRQVETVIGFIPIAPPVAEFLKAKPYLVATRIDFLTEIATRILCGPDDSGEAGTDSASQYES